MKKFIVFLGALMFVLSSTITAFAADVDMQETPKGASFEIRDVVDYSQAYGIRNDDAITRIPIKLSLGQDINTELLVEIAPSITRASGTLNFTVSGNFYRKSDNVTVTVYGLSGSFEYSGSDTEITGKDSYHNSTADGWTGTSRTSTSKEDNYYNPI